VFLKQQDFEIQSQAGRTGCRISNGSSFLHRYLESNVDAKEIEIDPMILLPSLAYRRVDFKDLILFYFSVKQFKVR